MAVPNTFANATTAIPLVQLDQNFATPITIGNTTVALGNTSNTITPNSVAGIVGTTTNDSVQAGSVGEFVESAIATGSAISYSAGSGNPQNITFIALTAGDWDVEGCGNFSGVAPVSASQISFNTTTNTHAASQYVATVTSAAANFSIPGVRRRFSLTANANVYMVATIFNPSTNTMYGYLNARRAR